MAMRVPNAANARLMRTRPVRLMRRRKRGGGFTPINLFANGEQGVWYDPSDLTTLFQDSAGTIPAAFGQPVGLMLDKSKGGIGPELAETATWVASGPVTFAATGKQVVSSHTGSVNPSQVSFPISLVAGRQYIIDVSVSDGAAATTSISMRNGSDAASSSPLAASSFLTTSGANAGQARLIYTANATATAYLSLRLASGSTTRTFTVSVREIPGNHASQATPAARPILGREPKGGRRNLLTYSEDFGNAAWAKTGATISGAKVMLEATSSGIHRAIQSPIPISTGARVSITAKVKPIGGRNIDLGLIAFGGFVTSHINSETGALIRNQDNLSTVFTEKSTAVIGPDAEGYLTVTISAKTAGITSINAMIGAMSADANNYIGVADRGIEISYTQLETGGVATPYQKVVSEYDVTEAGVPSLHYLRFDGLDDELISPPVIGLGSPFYLASAMRMLTASGTTSYTGHFGSSTGTSWGVMDLRTSGNNVGNFNIKTRISGGVVGSANGTAHVLLDFKPHILSGGYLRGQVFAKADAIQQSVVPRTETAAFPAAIYVMYKGGALLNFYGGVYRYGDDLEDRDMLAVERLLARQAGLDLAPPPGLTWKNGSDPLTLTFDGQPLTWR